MVLLLGWPVDELPYHVLVAPLVAAGCQVLQTVPLDGGARTGAHCAVVAARVDHLAPLRTYLDDSPIELTGDEPGLRTLLRLAAEHTFADLVSRPLRHELAGLRDRVEAQQERIRRLEDDVRTRDVKLTAAHQRLAQLRSSTKFRVGDAVVQGARRPGRAIISVPFGLVRVWRNRGADRG